MAVWDLQLGYEKFFSHLSDNFETISLFDYCELKAFLVSLKILQHDILKFSPQKANLSYKIMIYVLDYRLN